MAEQISFYDRLKSDLSDEAIRPTTPPSPQSRAATSFATNYQLGAEPGRITQSILDKARREGAVDTSDLTRAAFEANRMAEDMLQSPRAQTDPTFRARMINRRDNMANLARQVDVTDERSVRGATNRLRALAQSPTSSRVPRGQPIPDVPLGPARAYTPTPLRAGSKVGPAIRADEALIRRVGDRVSGMDVSSPTYESDRVLSESFDEVSRATDRITQADLDDFNRLKKERQILSGMPRNARKKLKRSMLPPSDSLSPQLDLYRNTKNLIKSHGTDAIRAGKSALGSPAVRRGLGVAAGLLGSKFALAATSGGADLVMELAVGAPQAFIEGYNRSQDPYEQVKYVAEGLGPIDKLQSKSLASLSYDDVVRLQQEGHLTPKAEQQYRQHVIETEGFDPNEVYLMGAGVKKPRVVLDEIEITADSRAED